MTPFDPPNTSNQPGGSTLLDRLMAMVRRSFDSLAKSVTNDSLVFAHLDATDRRVYHGLGHVPTTWEVVDKTTGVDIYRTAPMTADYIVLHATGVTDAVIRFS